MRLNIDKIRAVEWGRTYLWEVRFIGKSAPKAPFNDWFPAVHINENLATINTMQISAGTSTYEVPQSTTLFDITIDFVDDVNLTLEKWLTDWINSMVVDGRVQYLENCVRDLLVMKLGLDREPISTKSYRVFPSTALYFDGNSESAVPQYSCKFIIAGTTS